MAVTNLTLVLKATDICHTLDIVLHTANLDTRQSLDSGRRETVRAHLHHTPVVRTAIVGFSVSNSIFNKTSD